MPHCGIFDMIGVEGYKVSDHFYSAPPQIYAPIWYICQEWGWGISHLTTSLLPLREIMPHCGIFDMIGVGGYKLSDHFYSAPSQV